MNTPLIAKLRMGTRSLMGDAHRAQRQYPDDKDLSAMVGLLQKIETKLSKRLQQEQEQCLAKPSHLPPRSST